MKFATFSEGNLQRVGVIVGNESGLVDLLRHVPDAPREMIELMSRWSDFRPKVERAASHPADFPLTAVKLHAPVPIPGKILAIGLNYLDHIEETHAQKPEYPTYFAKMTSAANGPFDPIQLPAVSEQLDYEAEDSFSSLANAAATSRAAAPGKSFSAIAPATTSASATGSFAPASGSLENPSTHTRLSALGSPPVKRSIPTASAFAAL